MNRDGERFHLTSSVRYSFSSATSEDDTKIIFHVGRKNSVQRRNNVRPGSFNVDTYVGSSVEPVVTVLRDSLRKKKERNVFPVTSSSHSLNRMSLS
jgi:hypothetical protein